MSTSVTINHVSANLWTLFNAMDDELEVLHAIYGGELESPDHLGWRRIRICGPLVEENNERIEPSPESVYFEFLLHPTYPDDTTPQMRLIGLTDEHQQCALSYLQEELIEPGEACMFPVISWLMSDLADFLHLLPYEPPQVETGSEEVQLSPLEIITGDSITDRKSTYDTPVTTLSHYPIR